MVFRVVEDMATSEPKANAKYCPCLCQAISLVGRFGRIAGISPFAAERHPSNKPCNFFVSPLWRNYSYIIQVAYCLYVLVAYSIRLHCGADPSNVMQWYFITFGYFITDINSICSLMIGTLFAKRACGLYNKLSLLQSSAREMHYLRSFMNKFILTACLLYSITFPSYFYIAFLKINLLTTRDYCNVLDFPFAIIGRGFTLIFPTIELFSITTIVLIIRNKYKNLKGRTSLTCKMYTETNNSPGKQQSLSSLKQLAIDRREISCCLKEANFCVGLQLLIACVCCLYTSIFYLYRYSTSHGRAATYERIHYMIGLVYRTGKLIVYMILGQEISKCSQEPLRVLQNADIMELSFRTQQQLQTLILQWSDRKELLTAVGVVNMGLWLLAPIVGNVITYLLVALQFENHNVLPNNVTAILEYIF